MGNKLIGFSTTSKDTSKKEVYVDLDMTAKRNSAIPGTEYKVSRLVNVQAVQNSLMNLFNWIPGERVIQPEYGSNLRKMLYRGITPETEEAIIAEIRHSISEWEPRVILDEVINVSTVDDTENNTIHLRLVYRIVGLNNEQFSYTYEYRRATV